MARRTSNLEGLSGKEVIIKVRLMRQDKLDENTLGLVAAAIVGVVFMFLLQMVN